MTTPQTAQQRTPPRDSLFCAHIEPPLREASLQQLGTVFLKLFSDSTNIYEGYFKEAPFIERLITPHYFLSSFKHFKVESRPAIGISIPVNILHSEFRIFANKITQAMVPVINRALGPEGRITNPQYAEMPNGRKRLVALDDSPPSADAQARLNAAGPVHIELRGPDGKLFPLLLENDSGKKLHGAGFLHTALALRDQVVSAFDRSIDTFRWIREVAGLQDTVFSTMVAMQRLLVKALAEQHPDISADSVGLDISRDARAKIELAVKEQAHSIRWSDTLHRIHAPGDKIRFIVNHRSVVELAGEPAGGYAIQSPTEAASILFALTTSIPVETPKIYKVAVNPLSETIEQLRALSFDLADCASLAQCAAVINRCAPHVETLTGWLQRNTLPTSGASEAAALLNAYVASVGTRWDTGLLLPPHP